MEKAELDKLVRNVETLELNDKERAMNSGSFISLPCGITHYQMESNGEPVVLTHGYATPYKIYDKLFDALVEAGYKVIRYDLLGRGLSQRTHDACTPDLFARQLNELTKKLLGDEKFYLIGTSMGGTVTTAFCRFYPGRVKKLVLLAPAGMDSFNPPFYMKLCEIPGFGKALFKIIGGKTLIKNCAGEMTHTEQSEVDDFTRYFAMCAEYKGFINSTFSSLINCILNTKEATEGYKSVNEQKIPMLVVWGTADRTMPYYQIERMKEVCPNAEYITFEGSGHVFLYDEGKRTADVVLPFLKK